MRILIACLTFTGLLLTGAAYADPSTDDSEPGDGVVNPQVTDAAVGEGEPEPIAESEIKSPGVYIDGSDEGEGSDGER